MYHCSPFEKTHVNAMPCMYDPKLLRRIGLCMGVWGRAVGGHQARTHTARGSIPVGRRHNKATGMGLLSLLHLVVSSSRSVCGAHTTSLRSRPRRAAPAQRGDRTQNMSMQTVLFLPLPRPRAHRVLLSPRAPLFLSVVRPGGSVIRVMARAVVRRRPSLN